MSLDFEPEQLLKVGLIALRKREYDRAIATFDQLQQAGVPKSLQVKAQMGLVQTYEEQGQWQKALGICDSLQHSGSRQVKTWAQTKAAALTQRQAQAQRESHDLSGFQPLTPDSRPEEEPVLDRSATSTIQPPTVDRSGFQPIPPSIPTERPSSPQPSAPPETASTDRSTQPLSPAAASSNTGKNSAQETAAPHADPSDSAVSLFHYQALNQGDQVSTAPNPSPTAPSESGSPKASPYSSSPTSSAPDFPTPPSPVSPTSPAPASPIPPTWHYAGRLKSGRSLGQIKSFKFWLAQGVTAVFLFGLLRFLLHTTFQSINRYLQMLDRITPFGVSTVPAFYQDHTWTLLGVLLGLGIASPWLWDLWLTYTAGLKPFSTRLLNPHSPEAVQMLRRVCLRRNWPFPTLKLLPTDIPLIFSYGCLPRFARIVVSQGLLDQLKDDEIAVLYAYEMGHWCWWAWPLLSLQGLLMQLFHQAYWRLSLWGNRQVRLVHVAAGIGATVSYGIFWLLNKVGVWLSRLRTYYCDRTATEITGNPNGLIRALGKLSLGLANAVQQTGYTPPLVESLDLQLPVNATGVLCRVADQSPSVEYWTWDVINPWRGWLSVNQSHPPLGDRLLVLTAYARHWKLELELDFQPLLTQYGVAHQTRRQSFWQQDWRTGLLQAGPWVGLGLGLVVGLLLWGVGALANLFSWSFLDWLYRDMSVLRSSMFLGFGIGILLRMNRFFPDLDLQMPPNSQDLPGWLVAPDLIPVDSLPTRLSGMLLGRPGIANWLGQDLFLKTDQGLLKLHFFSRLGPVGNILRLGPKPFQSLNCPVQLWGWLRRGQQVWIDIDRLTTQTPVTLRANHPMWSLWLLLGLLLSGLWILISGGN